MAYQLPRRNDAEPAPYRLPDKDFYTLEFVKYDEPTLSAYLDKATGDYPWRIRLVFAVRDDDDFAGVEVSKWVDVEVNSLDKGSIYHVLAALDPDNEPQGGEPLDDYLGKTCKGEIVHVTKPSKVNPGQMLTYANVTGLKPLKRRRKTDEIGQETMPLPARPPRRVDPEPVDEPLPTGPRTPRGGSPAWGPRSAFNVDDD
jgi:hypothetical protein